MPSPMESRLTLKFMALWWRVPVVTWLCTCRTRLYPMPIMPTLTSTAMLFVAKAIRPGERPSSKSKPRWNVPLIGESAANLPCEPPKSRWMSVKMPKRFDSPKGM